MDKLCRYIDKELDELENKVGMGGKLSRAEIEDGKNLAKFKMALLTNEAMEEDDGYSGARGRDRYAKRDSMGRYSSDSMYHSDGYGGRYSRDDSKHEMMEHLHDLEMSAPDERTRRMIQEWKRQAERE